ncbi:MAG: dTDP-4-dehydrorhamnose reductase [Paracoccaceae bacterium]
MRIVELGCSGQVARELARRGIAAAHGRDSVDFSDPAAVRAFAETVEADALVNAAAYTAVDRAEDEPALAETINGTAVAALAGTAAKRGLPLVHLSTDYVFDGAGTQPIAPDALTAPLNVYGRSKLIGEQAIRAAGGPHAILRTSWVFSAHGSNFVRTMLRLAAERDRLRIVADQVGGPTPASAIAGACLHVAAHLARDPGVSGTYHFTGTPDVSWAGFAHEIFARAGLNCAVEEIPTAEFPTPAQRPLNSRLDCASFEARFGITRPDWKAALDAVLDELGARA